MSTDLTPRDILELGSAFQRSRAFLTACELDLFTILNDEERRSAEVAAAIGSDPRATDRLMNALTALGLLEKHDGRFRNTPVAAAHLVKGRPGYMAGFGHTNHLWQTWSGLTDAVRRGGAAPSIEPPSARGDEWRRAFIAAMHTRARPSAADVVGLVDLDGVQRILDVGGGSGAYAMAFVRARRGITAVVFDLPEVLPLTRGYIQAEGLSAEIETVGGDYLRDPIGTGYDLVFMSAVIHSNAPDENRLLFRKAAEALVPGGRLVVVDFLMAEDRTGPVHAALFALNMLVGTRGGDTFTESEVRSWMAEAGFHDMKRLDTPFGTNMVMGTV